MVRGGHVVLSGRAAKYRRRHLPHRAQFGAGKRFRMSENQKAAFAQMIAKALEHDVLRRLGEIDEDIAAEDYVKIAIDRDRSDP